MISGAVALLHSHINIVLPLPSNSQSYCLCLYRGFYNTEIDGSHKDQGKLSSYKEIRLVHLRILLNSLNICSDHTEEMGNKIIMIYYIVLSETRKN